VTHVTIPEERPITGDELLAMGDVGPCELIDGRIVPMTPTGGKHAQIEFKLAYQLGRFVEERKPGWVLTGEVGIYTRRGPDRVRGADLVFLSRERAAEGPPEGFLEMAPELVVEVVSPNDRWQDVRQKIEEYFVAGVEQVWVVDPDKRSILVYRSSTQAKNFEEQDTLTGEGTLTGFVLPVAELFRG
jgi:Uma2 family endonuclease